MGYRAVSEAIENAKEVIFIADWWLVSNKKEKERHSPIDPVFYFL
jgi:hypothetical protein